MGQVVYYQDIFQGGVTGDGFNPWTLENTGSFTINIDPSSSIRKAILFATIWENRSSNSALLDRTIDFNGNSILLSVSNSITPGFVMMTTPADSIIGKVIALDVTTLIDPLVQSYTLTPPVNQNPTTIGGVFSDYYLYVAYENQSMNRVSTTIVLNNQDCNFINSYSLTNLNYMDVAFDIGFTFNSTAICDTMDDGSWVSINGANLGLVGGFENFGGGEPACTGVRGAFYYENGSLTGLDNDVANTTMSGTDALAQIQSYLTNPVGVNIQFEYQSPPSGEKTNPILEMFFNYSSPCDTFPVFVPNDTILCQGEQFQLNVSGGQNYEWRSTTSGGLSQLSCTDCANPIFTADTTAIYTVRIWNNDSCSVVRPIKILVNDLEIDDTVISPTDCGTTTGSIAVDHSAMSIYDVNLVVNGTNIGNDSLVNWIPEGEYIIHLVDENGCVGPADTVYVNSVINTLAQFTLNPSSGNAPLEVDITNTSQNATNYNWYVNNSYQGSQMNQYTFEDGGEYTIELIAWQYDPSCTDTFSVLITVSGVVIPTAFTPDNDNVNDYWEILQLNDYFPDNTVSIYNRWGTLIYQKSNGTYINEPWYGTYNGKNLPTGSYFYVIEPNDGKTEVFEGAVSIVR